MPPSMNRIVLHHSAGPGVPTAEDRAHYHRIVDRNGTVHDGNHPISANAPGKPLVDGRYAAHTRGLNTGAIGLSMSCMAGAQWRDPKGTTSAFPTRQQVQGMIREAARLARLYSIPITRDRILSHAEVEITLGVKQAGKWDFDYDPLGDNTSRDPLVIGDQLRALIRAEGVDEVGDGPVPAPAMSMPLLRRGASGASVKTLQRALGVRDNGVFGPDTYSALVAFQRRRQLRPDGICGPATWAALIPSYSKERT